MDRLGGRFWRASTRAAETPGIISPARQQKVVVSANVTTVWKAEREEARKLVLMGFRYILCGVKRGGGGVDRVSVRNRTLHFTFTAKSTTFAQPIPACFLVSSVLIRDDVLTAANRLVETIANSGAAACLLELHKAHERRRWAYHKHTSFHEKGHMPHAVYPPT
jgi:hypothetical protein